MSDLQEGLGGKLHVFMSTLPKLGLHGLTPRQAGPATDNQQKQMVLLPAHKGYQQMAEDAAEHQVQQQLVHTLYRLHLAAFLSAFSCAAGPLCPACLKCQNTSATVFDFVSVAVEAAECQTCLVWSGKTPVILCRNMLL